MLQVLTGVYFLIDNVSFLASFILLIDLQISPVFTKLDNTSKDNYRPLSTLSNIVKLFETIIYSQLND